MPVQKSLINFFDFCKNCSTPAKIMPNKLNFMKSANNQKTFLKIPSGFF
jgi:hypothetical protein